MYEAFFHLTKRPFSATPDASCCYPGDATMDALNELISCVEHGQGIGIFTAPAGAGKTLICRKLHEELEGGFRTAFIATGSFPTRRALLQAILYELNQPYGGMDEQELRLELISAIRANVPQTKGLALIIDEAHLLSERLLEEIRTLADLSLNGKPLVRVVLSGQLSLEETLTSPSLEALNQRIARHVSLDLLSRSQTADYISFRLKWAGSPFPDIFTEGAINLISRACDGIPRCINQLCDHSLLLAFVSDSERVDESLIKEALTDLKQLPLHWNTSILDDQMLEQGSSEFPEDGYDVDVPEDSAPHTGTFTPTASFEIGAEAESQEEILPSPEVAEDIAELEETIEAMRSTGQLEPATDEPVLDETDSVETSVESTVGEDISRGWTDFYVPSAALPQDTTVEDQFPKSPHADLPREEHAPRADTLAFPPQPQFSRSHMEEEPVIDRYAMLDAGKIPEAIDNPHVRPAVARRDIPETKQPEPHYEQFDQHEPAAAESAPANIADARPDLAIDHMLEALDEVLGDAVTISLPPMSPSTDTPHPQGHLEEQIGESVLDICLETQEFTADADEINLIDSLPSSTEEAMNLPEFPESSADSVQPNAERLPPRVTRFDIVLPEENDPSSEAPSDPPPKSGPNYKLVFSTLRKRQKKRA